MSTAKIINWVIAVIGVWEGVAPFVLGYSYLPGASWNAVLVGLTVITLAAWAALTNSAQTAWFLDWVLVPVGAWLILAPFILRYTDVAAGLWNAIIVGVVITGLSVWAAISIRKSTTAV